MAKLFPTNDLNPIGNVRLRKGGQVLTAEFETDPAFRFPYWDDPDPDIDYTIYRSTKHMAVGLQASGLLKPISEYANATAFGSEFAGFINEVVYLEQRKVVVYTAGTFAFELTTPGSVVPGQYLVPSVDGGTSKLHPFKVSNAGATAADAIARVMSVVTQATATIVHGYAMSEIQRRAMISP